MDARRNHHAQPELCQNYSVYGKGLWPMPRPSHVRPDIPVAARMPARLPATRGLRGVATPKTVCGTTRDLDRHEMVARLLREEPRAK